MEDRCRADSKTKARRETHKGHMGTTGYFRLKLINGGKPGP